LDLWLFSVSAGLRWQMDTFSSSNSVYITQMATKLQNPPVSLPPTAPRMTQAAYDLLNSGGPGAVNTFYRTYGTHFIVGFKMGGSMQYTYELQSSQLVASQSISGSFSTSTPFSGVAGYRGSGNGPNTSIKKTYKTNAPTDVAACDTIDQGTTFDTGAVTQCVTEWLKQSGYIKYKAYAVPYAFHPQFQEAVGGRRRARALLQDIPTVPVPDYKFADAGMLLLRLQATQGALTRYRFKADSFYFRANLTLSDAFAAVAGLQLWLRSNPTGSIDLWRPQYLPALGLVNAAANRTKTVPKGARCGWCVKMAESDTMDGCTATCTSTMDCSYVCPGQTSPSDCSYKGFTYGFYGGQPQVRAADLSQSAGGWGRGGADSNLQATRPLPPFLPSACHPSLLSSSQLAPPHRAPAPQPRPSRSAKSALARRSAPSLHWRTARTPASTSARRRSATGRRSSATASSARTTPAPGPASEPARSAPRRPTSTATAPAAARRRTGRIRTTATSAPTGSRRCGRRRASRRCRPASGGG
jgi:hypothetical protein